ncbi:MAG: sigma-54 dependent transcriptional regulator, partial [Candidatus Zixiibacteriota bacterium]
ESARRTLSLTDEDQRLQLTVVDTPESALELLREKPADVVFLDASDDRTKLLSVLDSMQQELPATAVIVTVVTGDHATAVDLLRHGTFDTLPDTCSPQLLVAKLRQAAAHAQMKSEFTALRQDAAMSSALDNLIGASDAMRKVKEAVGRVALTDIPVFLCGPSGSGKTLTARVMHYHSLRRHGAFVSIDCSAFDENGLHLILFGSNQPGEKKAAGRMPALIRAHSGTLFLKSIEYLPPSVQKGLLQFLKDYRVLPDAADGGGRVDVRTIIASAKPLSTLSGEAGLDPDLLQRLAAITVSIPSLKERLEDLPLLSDHILRRPKVESDRSPHRLSPEVLEMLSDYAWPGNVRELENVLKLGTILCNEETILPEHIRLTGHVEYAVGHTADEYEGTLKTSNRLLESNQRAVIRKALADNNWNFTQTAQALGIGRTTLWRKVRKYNLRQET